MAISLSSDFLSSAPHFAKGCEGCTYGLAAAPEIVGMLMLPEQRAVQMDEDLIEFCNCKAGHLYRQYLRKVLNAMTMETRRNVRHYVLAALVPSVHYESETA